MAKVPCKFWTSLKQWKDSKLIMTCNYLPGKSFITLTTGQSIDDGFSNWPAGKYIMKDFK